MSNLLYFLTTFSAVIPELIYFKRRTYFENKKNQGRHIKGRAIIVSNHISIIDYMMLMFVFFTRKIRCLVASVVYKKNKILNLLLKMCGAIKVERENYNLSFIQKSIDVLNKNKVLLIFPEGRLDNDKTKIRQFTTSYLLLALKTKSPIIPVYNDGNYGFKRRVHCMVGEKIYLDKYIDTDNPSKEQLEYLNKIVMSKIKELKNKTLINIEEDKENRYTFKKFLWDFGRFNIGWIVRAKGLKIHYKDVDKSILKCKKPFIICANHTGFSDPPLIMGVFYRRRMNILAADIIFKNHKIRSYFLEASGCIPINRESLDYNAIKKSLNALNHNRILTIFPEGKIETEDKLNALKGGAVLLATLAKVDILPIFIKKKTSKKDKFEIVIGPFVEIDKNKVYSLKEVNELTFLLFNQLEVLRKVIDDGKERDIK